MAAVNFDFSGVPPGECTLVLKSNHSGAITQRDVMGKVFMRRVQVKAAETLDASEDFGMNERP
jgi:hypothetical protein